MSEKYITKAEVLQWVQQIRPKFTTIPNRFMNKGHAWVDRTLVNLRIYTIPSRGDRLGFLKEAASCFILSLLCKGRIITQTTGELLTEQMGQVKYQFQRQQPMFFFAQGSAESFQKLLPYETFRMMGFEFCTAYKQYYVFNRVRGLTHPKGYIVMDKSSRGNYWNESVDYIEEADAEHGEIVSEGTGNHNREYEPNWMDYED